MGSTTARALPGASASKRCAALALLPPEPATRLSQQARHLESRIHQVCGRRIPVQPVVVLTRAQLSRDGWRQGVRYATLASLPAALTRSRTRRSSVA